MQILSRLTSGLALALQAVSLVVMCVVLVRSPHANRLLALVPVSGVLVGAIIGVGLRKSKAQFVRQHRKQLVLLISGVCVMTSAILFVLTFVRHRLSPYEGGAAGVAVAVVVLGLAASRADKTE